MGACPVGRVPLLTVLSGLSILFLLAVLASSLYLPAAASMGPALPVLVVFLIIFIGGLAWFSARRSLLLASGEKIESVFTDLPGT